MNKNIKNDKQSATQLSVRTPLWCLICFSVLWLRSHLHRCILNAHFNSLCTEVQETALCAESLMTNCQSYHRGNNKKAHFDFNYAYLPYHEHKSNCVSRGREKHEYLNRKIIFSHNYLVISWTKKCVLYHGRNKSKEWPHHLWAFLRLAEERWHRERTHARTSSLVTDIYTHSHWQ